MQSVLELFGSLQKILKFWTADTLGQEPGGSLKLANYENTNWGYVHYFRNNVLLVDSLSPGKLIKNW